MITQSRPLVFDVSRSVLGRRWCLRKADDRMALALSQRLSVPEVIGRVLAARGVDLDSAIGHLNPTLRENLPNPSQFKDMDVAAQRLAQAIMADELITVFGDYDVDGATSAALLKRFCEEVGGRLKVYIPDRVKEGYGPNVHALKKIATDGTQLLITVDCGTLAHEPLSLAAEMGLDVIVADHHIAEPSLPTALAVVNPNRIDEDGGYEQLAAVGVTFMLVIATNRVLRGFGWYNQRPKPDLMQWLDLVALGTVCDVVPLVGVNRALVTKGLEVFRYRRNLGLLALSEIAQISGPVEAYHLGFVMGPRVNAGGRVGKADLGTRLLTTRNTGEARDIASALNKLNDERRAIEAMVLEQALQSVERCYEGMLDSIIVVSGKGWHQGVIGIVASRLKDRFNRPAVVITIDEDGVGRGSARSIAGIDLGAAVVAAKEAEILLSGGGHAMAAGLTISSEKLNDFREFISSRITLAGKHGIEDPSINVDAAVAASAINHELYEMLLSVGPYGAGNPQPRFAIANAQVVGAKVVGNGHVRCALKGGDGSFLNAIAFGHAEGPIGKALLQSRSSQVHVVGTIGRDNRARMQLVVEDVANIDVST